MFKPVVLALIVIGRSAGHCYVTGNSKGDNDSNIDLILYDTDFMFAVKSVELTPHSHDAKGITYQLEYRGKSGTASESLYFKNTGAPSSNYYQLHMWSEKEGKWKNSHDLEKFWCGARSWKEAAFSKTIKVTDHRAVI